ncbi:MAG: WxcM-like domain-containing protein [Thermodesulfobacteriota bacterium]
MNYSITELKKFSDERGFLIEFLKQSDLPDSQKAFGQIYLATLNPGSCRGNHFHRMKDENFAIMNGRAEVTLEDIHTKERETFELDSSGEKLKRLTVGSNVAHLIKNISDQVLVLCAYTNKEYDSKNLDQEDYRLA